MKTISTILAITIIIFAAACQSCKTDPIEQSGKQYPVIKCNPCPEYQEYEPTIYQDIAWHFVIVSKFDTSKAYYECLKKFGADKLSEVKGRITILFITRMPDGYDGYLSDSKVDWLIDSIKPVAVMDYIRNYYDSVMVYIYPR